eukprot:1156472-Pelagomonas_calceolata.AAC.5
MHHKRKIECTSAHPKLRMQQCERIPVAECKRLHASLAGLSSGEESLSSHRSSGHLCSSLKRIRQLGKVPAGFLCSHQHPRIGERTYVRIWLQ